MAKLGEEVVGGYSAWSFKLSKEAQEVLAAIQSSHLGVSYRGLAFATQVVSGTNFSILCTTTGVTKPPQLTRLALVQAYAPLKGDPVLEHVIPVGPVVNRLPGGFQSWQLPASSKATQAFQQAMKGFVGVGYDLLGDTSQVVAGTNFCCLTKATSVQGDGTWPALVNVFQPLKGPAVLGKIQTISPTTEAPSVPAPDSNERLVTASFDSASLAITPATIVPPIYRLTVKGTDEDFGGVILQRQSQLSDGYIVFDVLLRVTGAIGSMPYTVTANVQQQAGTQGVLVRGSQGHVARLAWTTVSADATSDYHTEVVSQLTSLASVNSANVVYSSIMLNPSVLQVVAQPSGFNYKLFIVPHVAEPDVDYLPYLVVQIQTGPGWPGHGGVGPVVLPQHLSKPIYRTGKKGITVVGSNRSFQFDVKAPGV